MIYKVFIIIIINHLKHFFICIGRPHKCRLTGVGLCFSQAIHNNVLFIVPRLTTATYFWTKLESKNGKILAELEIRAWPGRRVNITHEGGAPSPENNPFGSPQQIRALSVHLI